MADKQKKPLALQQLHARPKKYLEEWLDFPAHVHQMAYQLKNPPKDRAQSRKDFLRVLKELEIPEANSAIAEKFGYGVRIESNGDRFVVVWEAHTEYYSYQVWHIPDDKTLPLELGPIDLAHFECPILPESTLISALDMVFLQEQEVAPELIRALLPGPHIYGSRIFGEDIAVVTSFMPDEDLRERYLIFSAKPKVLLQHLAQVADSVVTIENYYHLLLLPFPEFSKAVDRIHELEQRYLKQQETITAQIGTADSKILQDWLNRLTQDFLEVSRFAEGMRVQLSASVPYNTIVQRTLRALQENPLAPYLPLSDYVLGGISGVSDGYQQLIKRIEAMESDFQAIISVIRTRVNLIQQEQNLILEDQNLKLLSSVDQTTRSQAILQRTVEGLSVIVIAYYLSGLANYVFKALKDLGWIKNATVAVGLFVPVALVTSSLLIYVGRKVLLRRMVSDKK